MTELLLPILYTPIANFCEQNEDELVALAAQYQYLDWTQLRLEPAASAPYRKSVNSAARKLVDVAELVATRQLAVEIEALRDHDDDHDELMLGDLADKLEPLLDEINELFNDALLVFEQFQATWKVLGTRLQNIETTPGNNSAKFALLQRIATEELPFANRAYDNMRKIQELSLNIDPLIIEAFRMARGLPEAEALEMLAGVHERLARSVVFQNNFAKRVRGHDRILASMWAQQRAHRSKLVKTLANQWQRADDVTDEASATVDNWYSLWDEQFTQFELPRRSANE